MTTLEKKKQTLLCKRHNEPLKDSHKVFVFRVYEEFIQKQK